MAMFFEGSGAVSGTAGEAEAWPDGTHFSAGMVHRSHAHHEEHACHADYHNKKRHHRPEEHPGRNPIAAPRHRTAPCFNRGTIWGNAGVGALMQVNENRASQ